MRQRLNCKGWRTEVRRYKFNCYYKNVAAGVWVVVADGAARQASPCNRREPFVPQDKQAPALPDA